MELSRFTIGIPRNGRTVEVWQKGEGADLVFLHGAGGLTFWTPDLEALSKSFRVTAPIFPGFGVSDGVEGIDGVLDAVLHIFDALGELGIENPLLMGHSFGGMLAAEMAAICPNEVAGLVLVCPVGLWNDENPVLDFFTYKPAELVPYIFHNQKHPMALAMMVEPAEDELVDLAVAYIKGLSAVGRLLWPIPERGLDTRIGRIAAPTLIVWGESDGLAPLFYATEFKRLIPGSRLKIIQKASHMVLVEQTAETIGEIRRFLNYIGGKSRKKSTKKAAKKALAKKTPPKKVAPKAAKKKAPAKKAKKAVPKKKSVKKKTPKKKPAKKAKKKAAKKSRQKKSARRPR